MLNETPTKHIVMLLIFAPPMDTIYSLTGGATLNHKYSENLSNHLLVRQMIFKIKSGLWAQTMAHSMVNLNTQSMKYSNLIESVNCHNFLIIHLIFWILGLFGFLDFLDF